MRRISAVVPTSPARLRLQPYGLDVCARDRADTTELPLYCGTMHYFRHRPERWGAGLDAIRAMGLRLVDTYVPWGVHEVSAGVFDFGGQNPALDVERFVCMAGERGLKVVVRPGPHVNAELTYFGLPERIVWDLECQARTPRNNPVMLPMVPRAFPVPSYASTKFFEESARWLSAFARRLSPLRHPDGPIVLVQVDNEGALYFRDGPYDQDYHPDALALFREFIANKYGSIVELRRAYGNPRVSFDGIEPPRRFDARSADELPRHLDWMEFHEHLLAFSMHRMVSALADAGFDGVPTTHNFPLGEAATPLNAHRMGQVIDLVGLDYYHRANPAEHMAIMRRTTELVSRCEGADVPPFGAEVGIGFPPFFPPIDEQDSLYTLMAALAYGLRGFNLYMVVERDRWVGAPIDAEGRRRPSADAYEALLGALAHTGFHRLRRRAPVRLIVPRALRRLARATHAFGPLTPALFHVLGASYGESCLEEDFGTGEVAPLVGEAYLRTFERALLARGVPFAYGAGESLEASTLGARWVICAAAGGLKPEMVTGLRAARHGGAHVTLGPRVPDRDGGMRRLATPHDVGQLEVESLDDAGRADALVAERIDALGLPTYCIDPPELHVTVHEDDAGTARIVFVMNPTCDRVVATVGLRSVGALRDALSGSAVMTSPSGFELTVAARTVRMLQVDPWDEAARESPRAAR